MKRYQLMTIIDPTVGESNVASVQQSVEQSIEQRGGHIEEAARPERVTLATPMRGMSEGFRGFSVVAMPEDQVPTLQATLRHQEGLLRAMLVVARDEKRASGSGSSPRSRSFSPDRSAVAPNFEDAAIAREINAVIEREVEKVSKEEEKAQQADAPVESVETRISEEEVQGIDEKLDEILGS